jgi:hypothetical protein
MSAIDGNHTCRRIPKNNVISATTSLLLQMNAAERMGDMM